MNQIAAIPEGSNVLVRAGYQFSMVQKPDGTVWAWGKNNCGQLADGTTIDRRYPVKIDTLNDVLDISLCQEGNDGFGLALKKDRTVWAWGYNGNAQLGTGGIAQQTTPVQVRGLENVVAISAGAGHSMALTGDGDVWVWGSRVIPGSGLLNSISYTPYKLDIDDVVGIWAGWVRSYLKKSDGSMWAYGYGLPQGIPNTNQIDIVEFEELSDTILTHPEMESIQLGLRENGTVWVIGSMNTYGQFGIGTTEVNRAFEQVLIDEVIEIGAQRETGFALKSDGTVWTWGRNEGRYGDGTTEHSYIPVKIHGLEDVIMMSQAHPHSLVLKDDGTLWSWGFGSHSLGIGDEIYADTPQFVMRLWGDEEPTPGPTHIWVEVPVDNTVNLRATALPSEFEIKPAIWSSSDETIATVDSEGIVTGVMPGITYIKAKTLDGQHEATIGVLVVDSDIEAMRLEVKLRPMESGKLTATDDSYHIANDVVWTSADPMLVEVDTYGRITAGDDIGVTIISATTPDGDPVGSVYVRVIEA